MKDEWKIHSKAKFVICANTIELRERDGTYICSICCMDCVKQLEKAIKRLRSNTIKRKVKHEED